MLTTEQTTQQKPTTRQPSRRWSDRFPLDMEACVIAGKQKIWCQAVNISICGARVRLESTEDISGPIVLKIPRAGVDCVAEIVWSDDTDIGVKFKQRRRWYHRSSALLKRGS